MAEDRTNGLGAALGPLNPAGIGTPLPVAGDGAELDLFEANELAEGPVTKLHAKRARGPGRPPGSPNKRTADLRKFILQGLGLKHPLIAAAEIYSMPVDELKRHLGGECEARDALAIQIKCMELVAPYLEAKMPQKIAISDPDRLPSYSLAFGQGGVELRDGQGAVVNLTELARRAKTAMDQRLIEGEAVRSHDGGSQEAAKGLAFQDDDAS